MSRLSDDELQRELEREVDDIERKEEVLVNRLASERTHEAESHGHDNRVDELSEERATHPEYDDDEPWVRPSSLEAPPARDGMVQRWVRISISGADDPRNISLRSREGWMPRPMDTIPQDFQVLAGSNFGHKADASVGRFIVDDLLLCEMPEAKYNKRKAYYRKMTAEQMLAVEHDLESAEIPGHHIVKTHKTSVSHPPRVLGRRVEAADD